MTSAVLVTGGAGYIGSHACKALAAAGYLPVAYDNMAYGHRWAVRWGPLVEGDIADRAALRAAIAEHKPVGVMHFAAYTYVGESVTDPRKYFENNVGGTLSLLGAMVETGVRRIIFSSTCATYGEPETVPITEATPANPINPYGDTKRVIELALRWYGAAYGIDWLALRYFNAAGADPDGDIGEDHDPETHLIPLAIMAAAGTGKGLKVFGTDYPTPDGTAVRDYIHVTDLAEAHVAGFRLLEAGGASGAINLGTGSGYSVRQVIEAVERASGRKVPAEDAPRRPGDPPELVADASLAAERLGWRPRLSGLDEIAATAWRWHRNGPRGGK